LNFGNLTNSAFGFRFLDISRDFEPTEYDEHQRKIKNLENVESYFKDKFPTNKDDIKNIIPEIKALGHSKVDDIAVKTAKYIFDYLTTGATMQSMMENRMATKGRTYPESKVMALMTISEFAFFEILFSEK
jgi:uncharacterized protein YeeX (DUF496 family)